LTTCHRAENIDDPNRLKRIQAELPYVAAKMLVVFPVQPRTRKLIQTFGLQDLLAQLIVTKSFPFLDMVALEPDTALILTRSDNVQKEAPFCSIPCITMRDETECVETAQRGWSQLTGASADRGVKAVDQCLTYP
jgi:UDP-GlcNAc3NAcA epimerase